MSARPSSPRAMGPKRQIRRRVWSVVPLLLSLLWVVPGGPTTAQSGAPQGVRLQTLLALDEIFAGGEELDLSLPVAIAAGPAGELAVADAGGPSLWILRRAGAIWQAERVLDLPGVPVALIRYAGAYLLSIRGTAGSSPGLVAYEGTTLLQRRLPVPAGVVPGALASVPSEDRLLLYDLAGSRVLRFSADGELASFAAAGEGVVVEGRVSGLVATPGGGFLAAIAERGEIRRFGAAGELEASWSLPATDGKPAWPTGLALEPGGDVVAVDRHGHRLLVLSSDGTLEGAGSRRGWEPGLLLFPADVTRLEDGRLAVADLGNGRIQVFRRLDRPLDRNGP